MNKLYLSCFSKGGRQTSLDTNFKWYFSPVESKAELQTRQVAVHPCAAAAKTCQGNRKKTENPSSTSYNFGFHQNKSWVFVGLTTWRWQDGKAAPSTHSETRRALVKKFSPGSSASSATTSARGSPLGVDQSSLTGESSQARNLGSLTLTLAKYSWTTKIWLHRSKKVSFLDDFPYPKSMKKWRN